MVEAARNSSIQATLNNRLAQAATAGDSDLADAITALQASSPEVAVVILADTGADATNYPYLVCLQLYCCGQGCLLKDATWHLKYPYLLCM